MADSVEAASGEVGSHQSGILVLDDRQELLEAFGLAFEANGIPHELARTVDEAKDKLRSESGWIEQVLADNAIGAVANAGMDFCEWGIVAFPHIEFELLTGQEITKELIERAKAKGITIHDKGDYNLPDSAFDRLAGAEIVAKHSAGREVVETDGPIEIKSEVLEYRLREHTTQKQLVAMRELWTMFSDTLVRQIRASEQDAEGYYFINGRRYSQDELVEAVSKPTALGRRLVELHSKIVDTLLND